MLVQIVQESFHLNVGEFALLDRDAISCPTAEMATFCKEISFVFSDRTHPFRHEELTKQPHHRFIDHHLLGYETPPSIIGPSSMNRARPLVIVKRLVRHAHTSFAV